MKIPAGILSLDLGAVGPISNHVGNASRPRKLPCFPPARDITRQVSDEFDGQAAILQRACQFHTRNNYCKDGSSFQKSAFDERENRVERSLGNLPASEKQIISQTCTRVRMSLLASALERWRKNSEHANAKVTMSVAFSSTLPSPRRLFFFFFFAANFPFRSVIEITIKQSPLFSSRIFSFAAAAGRFNVASSRGMPK